LRLCEKYYLAQSRKVRKEILTGHHLFAISYKVESMQDYNVLLTEERYKETVRFWRERLAGAGGGFRWEVNEAAMLHGEYSAHPFSFSHRAVGVLNRLADDDLGRFAVMTAAAAYALARYFHRSPVIFKAPALADEANDSPYVPLILDVREDWTVGQYLGAIARTLESSYSHDDLALAALLEGDDSLDVSRATNVAIRDELLHEAAGRDSDEDVVICLNSGGEGAHQIRYKADRVESFLVRAFARHVVRALEQFDALDRRLEAIELLSDEERAELVHAFNSTAAPRPPETVVSLFEAQVERSPDAVALAYRDHNVTYRCLNARANHLARQLAQAFGPHSERTVGVRVDRAPDMIVAVLGALKACAAYVPIDTDYPADRAGYILDDARVEILITESKYISELPDFRGQILVIDLNLPDLTEPGDDLCRKPEGDETAYIIYTSGSTGKPKGCRLSHRNLSNYLQWATGYYFGEESAGNFGLYSSLSFDFTITNIFCPLLRGKRIVIYDQSQEIYEILEDAFDPSSLIDTMKLTPSHIRLLEQIGVSSTGVKRVIAGGEELRPGHVRALEKISAAIEVCNEYGPTEATVGCVVKRIEPGEAEALIGKPIDNARVYVLDGRGRVVPVGVRGEICVAGEGVAHGYNNRADLTAEKFRPNQFEQGGRLYRTGDVGRWLPDGNLQCFGRTDDQVKIRGFRVELGEIEAVLAEHAEVRQAVVIAREDRPGEKRIVAYVVGSAALTAAALREFVAARLPSFMWPAFFVLLEKLPLSPNGKIDKKALLAPEMFQEEGSDSYAAPTSVYQEEMLAIWREVLRRERIGIHDDFFELGGNSLDAVQVVALVWKRLEAEIHIDDVFNAPTIASLASRALCAPARKASESSHALLPAPRSAPRSGALPLSFAQQRLWFLDQMEPGNPAYNIPAAIRLTGRLDVGALEQSFNEIVRRHEVLRTRFVAIDGRAAQIIEPSLELRLSVTDLGHLPADEREKRALGLAATEARRGFDLAQAPLVRASLLRLGEMDHLLLLTMHHIVTDAWSTEILIREMAALYAAYGSNRQSPLEELPVQYADYAAWQRERLTGETLERELAYWKKRLAGAPSVLELPSDRPRPAVQSYRGEEEITVIEGQAVEAIKELSRREGVTTFMTLLAAFTVLLHRYSGSRDLCIGTPIAGRNRAEVAGLIGFFVNTLVIRVEIEGVPSFRETLRRAREAALGAFAHQEVPFEMLVDELQPERSLSHSPLFQVMFTFEDAPKSSPEIAGLKMEDVGIDNRTSKFDLSLNIVDRGESLIARLEYNTDLFDAATIKRMMGHFVTLVSAASASPDCRVSDLPIMTEPERHHLLTTWNDTEVVYDRTPRLHHLFEAQAERTPHATSLIYRDRLLSYSELNARANQLARLIREHGVERDSVVAICAERSPEMVIGLLAILKAGAAYLPLDPDYPADRLAFMLEDSKVAVLLAQRSLADRLPAKSELSVVHLDGDWQTASERSRENLDLEIDESNLAYVIYTSGSTGKPKGVMIPHEGIVNRLLWMQQAYRLTSADRVLQKTTFSFDVSVWEFFWPLITGAGLVLARPGGHRDSSYLIDVIVEHGVTTIHFVPSMLRLFVEAEGVERCQSLKRVIASGEALGYELQERFHQKLEATLDNLYGPTEASVDVTHWECERESDLEVVPIGRPVANTQIYILDQYLNLAPIGAAGELHIGGKSLARGYNGRAGLTAERFIPSPFSREPGARLYQTGDLARQLPNGSIEYLGRIDHQVKVRGFRIELGEIEAALDQHPLVSESVVVAREDGPGQRRLVAYVVASHGETISASELRGYLKERLPDYMVPAAIVEMEALPLSANGKIDRKRLPAPDGARLTSEYVAPPTSVEQSLADIWSEVLGVKRVGIHDNFFELGGDSILSIMVIFRARKAGLRLTTQQIFQHQTIAELAAAAVGMTVEAEQGLVTGDIPLTPVQRWFFEHKQESPHHFNQSILLETPRDLNVKALDEALGRLTLHHDALRLRFNLSETEWAQAALGEIDRLRLLHFDRVDLSGCPPPERAAALEGHAARMQASLNISEGPLLAAAHFDFGPNQPGRLLLIVHHLAIDGVSWRILVEDLITVYVQLLRDAVPQLPPKTTSYKQWGLALDELAKSQQLADEADYWAAPARSRVKPLPVEGACDEAPNIAAYSEALTHRLGACETRVLIEEAQRQYRAQANEMLLAALAIALKEWSGERLLLIDIEHHGREELFESVDLSRTVGWFTTIAPALFELPDSAAPGDALRAVKEQMRAMPRRGIGYGLLRYSSGAPEIQSRLKSQPPAQIIFNYLGQTDQVLASYEGWRLAPEPTGSDESATNRRAHLIEVNAIITGGELRVDWVYSRRHHSRETIQQVIGSFDRALRALLAACAPDIGALLANQTRLKPESVEDVYMLSPLQSGMLFRSVFEPESEAYFEQLSCVIEGPLDVDLFRRAWERVVERQAVLRTAFAWEGLDEPLQIVLRSVELPWELRDLEGIAPDEQRRVFERFLEEDRARKFDLSAAPAFRLALTRLAPDRHAFCWSHHHILLDGWSVSNLLEEVMAFYESGGQAALPEARAYRSYIDWIQEQDAAESEAYWRDHLSGFDLPTRLPTDGERSSERRYDKEEVALDERLSERLRAVAGQHHITPNTLMRGVWAILLSCYGDDGDVCFGVTLAGRPAALDGAGSMAGLFINTLPLRVKVDENARLSDWLRQIQDLHAEIEKFSHTSLADVQRWADIPAGMRLFESILIFENYPINRSFDRDVEGLRFSSARAFEQTEYPLTLAVVPGRGLHLRLRYDQERFDKATVHRILSHIQNGLEAFAARPDRRICDVEILGEDERRELNERNDAAAGVAPQATIGELFERRAELIPDATAVVCEDRALSFHELNERSNRLANLLAARGVTADAPVALLFERSVEMIVAVLGVLKAGGACLPLDAASPGERLLLMLDDARASIVLTQERLRERISSSGRLVICLDKDWDVLSRQSPASLSGRVMPENLAYVIYTSGSSGNPKGASIEHRAIVNLLDALDETVYAKEAGKRLRIGVNGPLAFDTSVKQVIQILNGHTLFIIPEHVRTEPAALVRLAHEASLDALDCTPSYLELLLDEGLLEERGGVAVGKVLVGGEAIPEQMWQRLAQSRATEFYNVYGPTETTVDATVARITKASARPVIGGPIRNVRVYVVDRRLRRAPVGVMGELCIGGAGLARGYLGDTGLTAASFAPDPFAGASGARMYRTGDLARLGSDGELELLGRRDDQVKVRGFRVELREIEAALEQHADVAQAVVIQREDRPKDKRLVAYFVARSNAPASSVIDGNRLRLFLKDRLPDYMTPDAYVEIERVPLTSRGKLDRKALPPPGARRAASSSYVPPRDDVERRLVEIWQQTLEIDGIGIQDNFFELGGHSILAMRVAGRIQSEFQKHLALAQLFNGPTVAQVADALRDASEAPAWQTLIRMHRGGTEVPIFLLPGAGGNVLYYYELAKHLGRHRPVYGLQATGLDGKTPPLASVEEIARHNIEKIIEAQPRGPYLLAGHSFGGKVAFEMSQQLRAAGREVGLVALFDTPAPVFERTADRKDWDDARWLAQIVREIEEFLKIELSVTYEELCPLDEQQRLDFVMDRIQRTGWWATGGDRSQLTGQLQVYKTNFQIAYAIRRAAQRVPIALFKAGTRDDAAAGSELAALLKEPAWGWAQFSSREVEVYEVPGDHLTMMADGNAAYIAERLTVSLGRLEADRSELTRV
jgi:amino acid adenylation domain-containing protein/non-ribosomal peptide synthase protein (TIGR01720 family)